jgi:phosphoserine aminotransferase
MVKRAGWCLFDGKMDIRKAKKLYEYIGVSGFYGNSVSIQNRSIMNVPFILKADALDSAYIKGADDKGLLNLKGHCSVGGMRVSIYNAVTEQAVDALIHFMQNFAARNSQICTCVQMLNHRS